MAIFDRADSNEDFQIDSSAGLSAVADEHMQPILRQVQKESGRLREQLATERAEREESERSQRAALEELQRRTAKAGEPCTPHTRVPKVLVFICF